MIDGHCSLNVDALVAQRRRAQQLVDADHADSDLDLISSRLLHAGLDSAVLQVVPRTLTGYGRETDHCPASLRARAVALCHVRDQAELDGLVEQSRHVLAPDAHGRLRVLQAWSWLVTGASTKAQGLVDSLASDIPKPWNLALVADVAHFEAAALARREGASSRARHQADLAVALYRHLGLPGELALSLTMASSLWVRAGRLRTAAEYAREALQLAEATGNVREALESLGNLIVVGYRSADFELTAELFPFARRLLEFEPSRRRTARFHLLRARCLMDQGRVEAAETAIDEAEGHLARLDEARAQVLLNEFRGRVHLAKGEPVQALEFVDRAIEHLDPENQSYELAELQLHRAQAHLSLAQYDVAERYARSGLATLDASHDALDRGQLLHALGAARYFLGRKDEGLAALEEAEQDLRALGDRLSLGLVQVERAGLHLSMDPATAEALATEAVHLFQFAGVEERVDEARQVIEQARALKQGSGDEPALAEGPEMVAESPAMQALVVEARQYAINDSPVLITGETGVGKELLAGLVHRYSRRRGELVAVNCAAIAESLFESELFGHAEGAFTDANRAKPGLVEAAEKGTLFLDEIGELGLAMQAKLLRLLQDGTFRRVGGVAEQRADIRLVAATNRSLVDEVSQGRFREDLLYRLRFGVLHIPPLRERPEDLEPLVEMFHGRLSRDGGPSTIDPAVLRKFRAYWWPGNVRELQSVLASAVARAGVAETLRLSHLPKWYRDAHRSTYRTRDGLDTHLANEEKRVILATLRRCEFNRSEAARALGISRNTLYVKLKKLGIVLPPAY